jgi:hypothetical protein
LQGVLCLMQGGAHDACRQALQKCVTHPMRVGRLQFGVEPIVASRRCVCRVCCVAQQLAGPSSCGAAAALGCLLSTDLSRGATHACMSNMTDGS